MGKVILSLQYHYQKLLQCRYINRVKTRNQSNIIVYIGVSGVRTGLNEYQCSQVCQTKRILETLTSWAVHKAITQSPQWNTVRMRTFEAVGTNNLITYVH